MFWGAVLLYDREVVLLILEFYILISQCCVLGARLCALMALFLRFDC